jgi:hypothetical protein
LKRKKVISQFLRYKAKRRKKTQISAIFGQNRPKIQNFNKQNKRSRDMDLIYHLVGLDEHPWNGFRDTAGDGQTTDDRRQTTDDGRNITPIAYLTKGQVS